MNNELIGKVQLDYSHYSGDDLYCDGAVEDELLNIVKTYSPTEFPGVIEANKSWPIMYHLSRQRENIVTWLPITKDMKVLEIGSGCGAITGALSEMAGEVSCVDLSRKRSLINAYRHEYCDNIKIHVGNFLDIEPDLPCDYDFVLLIGVLEYAQSYIGGETPFEDFLRIVRRHAGKNGRVVIAIENRYGLKYWSGCREDHLGTFFSSIECYKDGGGVRTFSRKGLEDIMGKVGASNYSFYYPYPDYKFMTTVFSDRRLPDKGELCNNLRNFDRDRMMLFDEKAAWDGLLYEEQFPFFSNSYVVVIGDEPDTDYVRYSNDRSIKYQITTTIAGDKVYKRVLFEEGKAHIENMVSAYKALKERYEGGELNFVEAVSVDDRTVAFKRVNGVPLTEKFDELLDKKDDDGFLELLMEFYRRVDYGNDKKIADFDLVFSNVLVDGDTWNVIDYEWTKEKSVATKEIVFRALYCYMMERPERCVSNYDLILEKLGITVNEADGYKEDEAFFQKEVTDRRLSMGELRNIIGGAIISKDVLLGGNEDTGIKRKVQIYTDLGRGFNEDDSFFIDSVYDKNGYMEFAIPLESNTFGVRIDPMMEYCMTTLQEVSLNGKALDLADKRRLAVNGRKIVNDGTVTVVFATDDPNMSILTRDVIRSSGNLFRVKMTTTVIPKQMAESLNSELSKKIRL